MSDRDSLFAEAAKKKKMEKEETDRRRSGGGFTFDPAIYAPLHMKGYSSIRILGNPAGMRMDDATSPKVVCYSKIVGDDDRQFRCIWPDLPTSEDGKTWFLSKVYNKVLAYKWDGENNERNYYNKKSHPAIFNRVFKNGRPEVTFEAGWKPVKTVQMNVIDRALMSWHKEEKHSALIAKKVSESKKQDGTSTMYYEPGIPSGCYDTIWDEMVENYGDFENYDVVVFKTNELPFYKVYHSVDEFKKFAGKDKVFEAEDYLAQAAAPLTAEERSWERYDIDKMFPITSYTKIMSKLKIFITSVDEVFNTNFMDELTELVAKEKAARPKKEETVEETKTAPVSDNVLSADDFDDDKTTDTFVETSPDAEQKAGDVFDDIPDEAPAEATPPLRTRKAAVVEPEAINWDELGESLSGISKMTNAEKGEVTSYNSETGTFVYAEGVSLFSCPTNGCTMKTPETFVHCPACGIKFE